MSTNRTISLYFSRTPALILEKVEFKSSNDLVFRLSTRGKTALGVGEKYGSFQWTQGVKSVCKLFILAKVFCQIFSESKDEEEFYGLLGNEAIALYNVIRAKPSWMVEMFGVLPNGRALFQKLFKISPAHKRCILTPEWYCNESTISTFIGGVQVDDKRLLIGMLKELGGTDYLGHFDHEMSVGRYTIEATDLVSDPKAMSIVDTSNDSALFLPYSFIQQVDIEAAFAQEITLSLQDSMFFSTTSYENRLKELHSEELIASLGSAGIFEALSQRYISASDRLENVPQLVEIGMAVTSGLCCFSLYVNFFVFNESIESAHQLVHAFMPLNSFECLLCSHESSKTPSFPHITTPPALYSPC